MTPIPAPPTEASRLAALARYDVLDTDPEPSFDDLAVVAAQVCATPVALVSLVDAERQWFKARIGLAVDQTQRDQAFCAHAILEREVFEIRDATTDDRFRDNPLVTGEPGIRFYAGAPLLTPDGHAVGTLCVIDRVPRDLDDGQRRALEALARQAVRLLEARAAAAQLAETLRELRTLHGLIPICAHCKRVNTGTDQWQAVERYVRDRTHAEFSHGICGDCLILHYPDHA